MSQSVVVEKYATAAEMPASNIAYLFYRNLKDEKNNYDEIHAVILFKDGSKMTFKYSREKLAIVDKKMNVVGKIVDLLKNKNFEGIKPFLKPNPTRNYDKDQFINNLIQVDPQFGNIKEFLPYGFRFDEVKDERETLHISCVLLRDKQSNEFSVDVYPTSVEDEIILMQYKL
jgi:hypothetical protein